MAERKSDRTTDVDNETSACANTAEEHPSKNSHKRRRRRSVKSVSDTSGTGSLTSTEYEKRDIPISVLDKATNWSDMLAARISELEAEEANPNVKIFDDILHSDSDVNLHLTFDRKSNKYVIGNKNSSSASKRNKRRVTFNIGDGKDLYLPEKNPVSLKVKQNDCLIRPVIYMADKATQTDLLPEPPRNSEITDAKNKTTSNVTSGDLVISDSTDSNSSLYTEEKYLEIISDKTDNSKRETALSSILNSMDEGFQNIREDFVRLMKISCEKSEDSFIKSLKSE